MIPTRGRGGGHDWIGVDALLWVDHVEIRLLLCRIKAVWGAMRQVRGVVVIVMVHEVKEVSKTVPCEEFIRRKKEAGEQEKRKEGKKEKRKGNGHRLESKGRGQVLNSTSQTGVHLFIFILFLPGLRGRSNLCCLASCSHRCDSTDRNHSSPITKSPNERMSTNRAW